MSRGNTAKFCGMECEFEELFMEWITKHDVKLANTFCKNWEPTRAKTNNMEFWEQDEQQLQKWKIINYTAVLISWPARSTVARNCRV